MKTISIPHGESVTLMCRACFVAAGGLCKEHRQVLDRCNALLDPVATESLKPKRGRINWVGWVLLLSAVLVICALGMLVVLVKAAIGGGR